ncbi:acyltransferase family protein [Vibrio sp. E150_011]
MKKKEYIALDLVRGIAALLVLIGHLRSLLFINWDGSLSVFPLLFYSITSLGHQGVLVFFVLSGFLISRSVIYKMNDDGWYWSIYLKDRLTRLLVVIVPAVFLGVAFDIIGIYLFPESKVYLGEIGSSVITYVVLDSINFVNVISNLFFIPTNIIPVAGSNGSLWSISYEFWSYILFPLILITIKSNLLVYKTLCIFFIFSIMYILGEKGNYYFSIWMIGAVVGFISVNFSNRYVKIKNLSLIMFFLFISSVGFSTLDILENNVEDFFIAISFGLFILFHNDEYACRSPKVRVMAHRLSAVSFSMYAIHLPVLLLLISFFKIDERLDLNIFSFCLFLITVMITLCFCFCFCFWFCFERNTSRVRAILNRKRGGNYFEGT